MATELIGNLCGNCCGVDVVRPQGTPRGITQTVGGGGQSFRASNFNFGGAGPCCNFANGRWKKFIRVYAIDYEKETPDPPQDWFYEAGIGECTETKEVTDWASGTITETKAGSWVKTEISYDWNGTDYEVIYTRTRTLYPHPTDPDFWEQETVYTDEDGTVTTYTNFASPIGEDDDGDYYCEDDYAERFPSRVTASLRVTQESFEADVDAAYTGVYDDDVANIINNPTTNSPYFGRQWTLLGCDPDISVNVSSSASYERRSYLKWVIPEHYEGSYMRVDWDEVFFPDGWDDEGGPAITVTARSWEWTGGDKTSPDFMAVPPPGELGSGRVYNARCINWHGAAPVEISGFPLFDPDNPVEI